MRPCNRIGYRRLYNEDLLEIPGYRKNSQGHSTTRWPYGQIHLVIAVQLGEEHFSPCSLELCVLND